MDPIEIIELPLQDINIEDELNVKRKRSNNKCIDETNNNQSDYSESEESLKNHESLVENDEDFLVVKERHGDDEINIVQIPNNDSSSESPLQHHENKKMKESKDTKKKKTANDSESLVKTKDETPKFVSLESLENDEKITTLIKANEVIEIETDLPDLKILSIQPSAVGKVIGSKGSAVLIMQKISGAKILVDQNFPDGENRQVKISGTHDQINAAVELVKDVVAHGAGVLQSKEAVKAVTISQVQTIMECPHSTVAKLIGSNGAVIREIQARSGSKIVIDQNFPDGQPRKVLINGTQNAVAIAMQLVAHVMEYGPVLPPIQQSHGIKHKYGPVDSEPAFKRPDKADKNKYAPNIPIQMQSNILLPQSVKVPSIASIQQPSPPIVMQAPAPYPSLVPGYVSPTTQFQQPQQALQRVRNDLSSSRSFEVPKYVVGRIIGKKGENVISISQKTGCKVQVDQNVPEGQPCIVCITGPLQSIPFAEELVRDIIAKCGPPGNQNTTSSQVGIPQGNPANSFGLMAPSVSPVFNGSVGVSGLTPNQMFLYQQQLLQYQYQQQQQLIQQQFMQQTQLASSHATSNKSQSLGGAQWMEYKTPEGQSYWYNTQTKVTQWNHPNHPHVSK